MRKILALDAGARRRVVGVGLLYAAAADRHPGRRRDRRRHRRADRIGGLRRQRRRRHRRRHHRRGDRRAGRQRRNRAAGGAACDGATTPTATASAPPGTDRSALLRVMAVDFGDDAACTPSARVRGFCLDMTARPPDSPLAARFLASPNRGERRGRGRPDCLILHYTGMPTGEAALNLLLNPASEVSAHYLVWEDGAIDQLVAESRPGVARGQSPVERRERSQLGLDRDRDRQSRP